MFNSVMVSIDCPYPIGCFLKNTEVHNIYFGQLSIKCNSWCWSWRLCTNSEIWYIPQATDRKKTCYILCSLITKLFIYTLIIAILPEIIPNWIMVGITVVALFNEQQPDALARRLIHMAVQKVFLFSRDVVSKAHFCLLCDSLYKEKSSYNQNING